MNWSHVTLKHHFSMTRILILFLAVFCLSLGSTEGWSLPPCPEDPSDVTPIDTECFMHQLGRALKSGPDENYRRTQMLSAGELHNDLGTPERWAYIAGAWDTLRFLSYYFGNGQFNWLAECQENNYGDNSFNSVDVEATISEGLKLGLDPDHPASGIAMTHIAVACWFLQDQE